MVMGWAQPDKGRSGGALVTTTVADNGDQANRRASQYLDNGLTQPTSSSRAWGALMRES
jgi:hypothetical protein